MQASGSSPRVTGHGEHQVADIPWDSGAPRRYAGQWPATTAGPVAAAAPGPLAGPAPLSSSWRIRLSEAATTPPTSIIAAQQRNPIVAPWVKATGPTSLAWQAAWSS